MATFRFTVEFGTDDERISRGKALGRLDALRSWIMQYPIRKYGTLFVSDVEINPVAWDTGYAVTVSQAGFMVLDPENVAKALEVVFDRRPRTDLIEPGEGPGGWLVPFPITEMSNLAAGQTVWEKDGVRVEMADFL